jgi:OmpA-OmpF porin, OOP family
MSQTKAVLLGCIGRLDTIMPRKRVIAIVLSVTFTFGLVQMSAFAAEVVRGEGVITAISGDTLTVQTDKGTTTVLLTPETKIEEQRIGIWGNKQVGRDILIIGLKVNFEGTGDQNGVTTKTLGFEENDLSLAKVVHAVVNPVAQQAQQNRQDIATSQQHILASQQQINEITESTEKRFSQLGQYSVKDATTIYFATGDYVITAEYKDALSKLAKEAVETGNQAYLIQVSGYADSVGSAVDNQILSKERAEAVVAYLLQECGIPVGRIVSPGALGETNPAASNETASGQSQNRRAEVKVLINKGIAGSGQ